VEDVAPLDKHAVDHFIVLLSMTSYVVAMEALIVTMERHVVQVDVVHIKRHVVEMVVVPMDRFVIEVYAIGSFLWGLLQLQHESKFRNWKLFPDFNHTGVKNSRRGWLEKSLFILKLCK